MTQKDWLLLIIPILCNGVVVFLLQQLFEKRQLVIAGKQEYVSLFQKKVDATIESILDVSLLATNEQPISLEKFCASYVDLFQYYQLNTELFKRIKKEMNQTLEIYQKIKEAQDIYNEKQNLTETLAIMSTLTHRMFNILQRVKGKCVTYRV